jgi:hypothetical protein
MAGVAERRCPDFQDFSLSVFVLFLRFDLGFSVNQCFDGEPPSSFEVIDFLISIAMKDLSCPFLFLFDVQKVATLVNPSRKVLGLDCILPQNFFYPQYLKMAEKFNDSLQATAEDISLLLSAGSHLGSKNVDATMEPYVYKRRSDGKSRSLKESRSSWSGNREAEVQSGTKRGVKAARGDAQSFQTVTAKGRS